MTYQFRWNEHNVEHIAQHGVEIDEAEYVVEHPDSGFPCAEADGRYLVWGQTPVGRYLQVVYIFSPTSVVYVTVPGAWRSKRNAGCGDGESRMAKYKRYDQMSADALAKATAEYDKPSKGPDLPGKPLTAEDRATHRRARDDAKAKMGRPVVGEGAKIVPVSIERGLLRQVDRYAKRHKLKRSQLVAEGLKMLLAK